MFSYIGIWKIYIVLYEKYKENKKNYHSVFLFLPSFAIWGSGILKESIFIHALGIIANIMFKLYFTKKSDLSILFGCRLLLNL